MPFCNICEAAKVERNLVVGVPKKAYLLPGSNIGHDWARSTVVDKRIFVDEVAVPWFRPKRKRLILAHHACQPMRELQTPQAT